MSSQFSQVDSMSAAVPDTLEQALSPEWLTAALSASLHGMKVTKVINGPIVDRVSTNARFTIECDNGVPQGLSTQLCVKGYFNEIGRASRQIGEPEAYFYRDLAVATGVRTLRGVYAEVDPATQHGVIVTEDAVAQGSTFLEVDSAYSVEQAAETLGEFARFHAATWNRPEYAELPWLAPRLAQLFAVRGLREISFNFDGPIGAGVPVEVRDAQRLFDGYRALVAAEAASSAPWCVIHGDAHVGNVFIDSAGIPSVVDWQVVQRGRWYFDVGYHIASALTVDDRRRSERDLLRHYLDRLTEFGVEAPAFDDAWRSISRGILHGFYLWGITQQVKPPTTTELLLRLGTAAADHDVYNTATE